MTSDQSGQHRTNMRNRHVRSLRAGFGAGLQLRDHVNNPMLVPRSPAPPPAIGRMSSGMETRQEKSDGVHTDIDASCAVGLKPYAKATAGASRTATQTVEDAKYISSMSILVDKSRADNTALVTTIASLQARLKQGDATVTKLSAEIGSLRDSTHGTFARNIELEEQLDAHAMHKDRDGIKVIELLERCIASI